MVHWHLAWIGLLLLSPLWSWTLPIAALMVLATLWVALGHGLATLVPVPLGPLQRVQKVAVVAMLHVAQPIVRFLGRVDDRLVRRPQTRAAGFDGARLRTRGLTL